MDLFKRFGYIAAAGDRHLAEFCEGKWYLESPERVEEMHFALTPVDARKHKRVFNNVRFLNINKSLVFIQAFIFLPLKKNILYCYYCYFVVK